MKTTSLSTITSFHGFRASGARAVYANRVTGEFGMGKGEMESAEIAIEAVKILAWMDATKRKY